jgi:protoheme IX farnesyltransferase
MTYLASRNELIESHWTDGQPSGDCLRKWVSLEYHRGMSSLVSTASRLKAQYFPLFKSRQTFLLALTGAAGYLCQKSGQKNWLEFSFLVISLLMAISGCTVLNMLFDRDIDSKMARTRQRPLAAGQVSTLAAGLLGTALVFGGLLWAYTLSMLYFFIVVLGAGFNVLVYTLWLKRRSAWSILWGGIAGGMPILAGRSLAIGRIDTLGILLSLIIILWIPSHTLTLGILYSEDYLKAEVPTLLSAYGLAVTQRLVIISSLLASILIAATFYALNPPAMALWIEIAASAGLSGMAFLTWGRPVRPWTARLYRYSSIFMLGSMLLLAFAGLI